MPAPDHRSTVRPARGTTPGRGPSPSLRLGLATALRRAGTRALAALVGAAVVVGVAMVALPQLRDNGADARGASARPADRVLRLISTHHCWTGTAPEGVTPSHAVVTRPGGRARVVPAEVGFAIWLDGAPGVLHAFCP